MAIFPFAQFELPGRVGLEDGRYLARTDEGEADDVLVISSLDAPRRARRRRARRASDADPSATAEALPATRATVIRATAFDDEAAAGTWLERIRDDADARDRFLADARVLLNRALHAHAVAAMDPYVRELGPSTAIAARVGYGDGDELAAGGWREAVTAPPEAARQRRRKRIDALRPQERLAAVLGGRDQLDACETLLMRARLDFDQGRAREAALQLRVGVESLLAELGPDSRDPSRAGPDQEDDLAAIAERRGTIEAIAAEAARDSLSEEQADTVTEVLGICERILRRRRILRAVPGDG